MISCESIKANANWCWLPSPGAVKPLPPLHPGGLCFSFLLFDVMRHYGFIFRIIFPTNNIFSQEAE